MNSHLRRMVILITAFALLLFILSFRVGRLHEEYYSLLRIVKNGVMPTTTIKDNGVSESIPSKLPIVIPEKPIIIPDTPINISDTPIIIPEESNVIPETHVNIPETHVSIPETFSGPPLKSTDYYFLHLPKGGIHNQLIEVWKSFVISRQLKRRMILPPMVASLHDSVVTVQSWSEFFNIEALNAIPFQVALSIIPKEIQVLRITNAHIGFTANNFCKFFNLECNGSYINMNFALRMPSFNDFINQIQYISSGKKVTNRKIPKPTWDSNTISKEYIPVKASSDRLVAATPILKVKMSEPFNVIGKYMTFNERTVTFTKSLVSNIVGDTEFIAVHWRRGDFLKSCEGTASQYNHCWPKVKDALNLILSIQEKEKLPVLLMSNTQEVSELRLFTSAGIKLVKHVNTTAHFGPFGEAVVDSCIPTLSSARVFIGNKFSTFSKIAIKRRMAWNKNRHYYFF